MHSIGLRYCEISYCLVRDCSILLSVKRIINAQISKSWYLQNKSFIGDLRWKNKFIILAKKKVVSFSTSIWSTERTFKGHFLKNTRFVNSGASCTNFRSKGLIGTWWSQSKNLCRIYRWKLLVPIELEVGRFKGSTAWPTNMYIMRHRCWKGTLFLIWLWSISRIGSRAK